MVLWVVWGQQMYGSTVPEASKLPVIFPMMQRSVHNHRESILLCCSLSASPAHRLTGCHNNPGPAPCLLEQNSGTPTTTATPLVTTPSRRIHWIPDKHSVCGVNVSVGKIRQNMVDALKLCCVKLHSVFFFFNLIFIGKTFPTPDFNCLFSVSPF